MAIPLLSLRAFYRPASAAGQSRVRGLSVMGVVAGAGMLSALSAAAAPPAAPVRLDMRFEMYGPAGLHLLTNRTTVDTSATGYRVTMALSTRGLAGVFLSLDSHSEAHGRLSDGLAQPQEFSTDIKRNGAEQQTRVAYGAAGATASTTPPLPPAETVPPAQTRGTVDELTAYFRLERQLARHGGCAAVFPVFDGRHRYDMQFSDAPPEALPKAVAKVLPGPTTTCAMHRRDIAGSTDRSNQASRGRLVYAFLPSGDRVVPVKMQFDTDIGAVTGELAQLQAPGFQFGE